MQDDMPGLAHFCEHLLFMVCDDPMVTRTFIPDCLRVQGTEQFPKENEYSEVR